LIVTVLGGGNGSHAAVVDLILRGHSVRWWRRPGTAFPDGGRLRYRLADELGVVTVANMSHHLEESIRGSDLILAPLPAPAQPAVLAALSGLLTPGQVMAFTPGSFGTWLGARARSDIAFLETATLPYLARLTGPAEISIPVSACNLPVGSLPGSGPLADEAHARFASIYPTAVRLRDGLDAALANWGPVIHPPLIIHNLGAIESLGKHFDIHAEGSSAAVLATTRALDAERIALREAMGLDSPHWPLEDYYAGREGSMYPPDAKPRLVASNLWRESVSLTHRYVREDILCGLAFNVALAAMAAVPTPVGSAILTLIAVGLDGFDATVAAPHGSADLSARTPRSLGITTLEQLLAPVANSTHETGGRGRR
jgi:opine dehydrogenase